MKQTSLFGNLPSLDKKTKAATKEIVKKANEPKKRKTVSVRSTSTNDTANRKMAAIERKVLAIIEAVKSTLIDSGQYELIRTEERFREYMETVRNNREAALDTETGGLDPILDPLVGLCLYTKGEKPAYIPINHTDFANRRLPDQIEPSIIREELEKTLSIDWILHNAKFDMRVLKNQLEMKDYINCRWDTYLASNFLNENEPHGLKPLWNRYVNRGREEASDSYETLFDKIPFNYIPIEIGYIYAAKDPKITYELYEFQRQFLDPRSSLTIDKGLLEAAELHEEVETPLIKYLCEMEDRGIGINKDRADELKAEYDNLFYQAEQNVLFYIKDNIDLTSLRPDLKEKLSSPINIGSPTQLAIILYDAIGMKSVLREKPRGTGEDALELLRKKNGSHFKLFDGILEYRKYKKLLTTYIEKLPSLVKEKTGKLHGQFNQYGAKTGRFSSSDPNLQNIPARNKEIRKMFIPTEGYYLIGADYSQQEPRVLAHLCWTLFGDDRMMNAYREGKDLYAWMASTVYSVPYEECMEKFGPEGKKRRDSVKSIILGLMYGRGAAAIGEQLGWTRQEAQRVVDLFFDSFPAIKRVIDYYIDFAKENGFVQTVWGRKRRIPDIQLLPFVIEKADGTPIDREVEAYYFTKLMNAYYDDRQKIAAEAKSRGLKVTMNDFKIADAERQTLNSIIQGTSADITKEAMKRLGESEELRELGWKMLLTVHDEIIGEAPKANAYKCKLLMESIMIEAAASKISVPMKVDAEIIEYWYGEDLSERLVG